MSDIDPYADTADRTVMADAAGALLFTYTVTESARTAQPWADQVWRPSDVTVEAVCETAMAAFPGWRLATADTALVAALERSGATELRHAHTMTHPLVDLPDVRRVEGLRVEQLTVVMLDEHADELGAMHVAAFPADHPDAIDGDAAARAEQLRATGRGELLGPLMDVSRAAWARDLLVGACLVVDRPGRPPHAGPWVIDVFRDPGAPSGVGEALLAEAMRAAAGHGLAALSLAVSHDNVRARTVYARLGFRDVLEDWTVELPAEGAAPASRSFRHNEPPWTHG